MVRIEITLHGLRQLIACIQFPKNYPDSIILLELKSKTLSHVLLAKLTNLTECELKSNIGKHQILPAVKFLKKFLEENPLSVCYDEILNIKIKFGEDDKSQLKIRQKSSQVVLKLVEGSYFLQVKINVPHDYFTKPVSFSDVQGNFPSVFERFLTAQGLEIARQCSEPCGTRLIKFRNDKERVVGGKMVKAAAGPLQSQFQPQPSLEKVVLFLMKTVKQMVCENCQLCRMECLPRDPTKAQRDESADDHVERVYCGHLFHLSCLLTFMKTPPFLGGKKCPSCGELVCHDKWRLTERMAENRWAHEQAKDRELQDVADFFNPFDPMVALKQPKL